MTGDGSVTTDSADSEVETGGGGAAPLSLRERVERLGKPPASWFKGNVCLLARSDARKLYGKKVPRKEMRQNLPIQGATAFLGPPGSGKTMFLTQAAANLSAAGCQVFSNSMELAFEDGHFRNFDELTDMVLKVAELPWEERPFTCVCIDEAPFWANARKWAEFSDGFFLILQQIRKFRVCLYYSAINWLQVDVNLRRLTYLVWECEKTRWGSFKRHLYPPEEERQEMEKPLLRMRHRPRQGELECYETGQIVSSPALNALRDAQRADRLSGSAR